MTVFALAATVLATLGDRPYLAGLAALCPPALLLATRCGQRQDTSR